METMLFKCLNCNQEFDSKSKYCPNCSQLNKPTELRTWSLIKEVIDQVFNINSRLFRTLKYIWRPSFLTREYIAGKRLRYVNPGRLFIFSMLFFFGALVFFLSENIEVINSKFGGRSTDKNVAKGEILDDYDAFIVKYEPTSTQKMLTDSIRKEVFKNIKNIDSNYIELDFVTFGMKDSLKKRKYLLKDIMELSFDSIYTKYDINSWQDQLFVKQSIKTYRNPSGTIKFILSNSFWIIILNILFTGLFLKLLYIRRNRYLIEHIILLCNLHSLFFIVATVILLISVIFNSFSALSGFFYFAILLISFLAFKRYYGQGFFKTLIKFFLYLIVYFFAFIVFMVFIFLISFLIF